jgi:hypothetical protein
MRLGHPGRLLWHARLRRWCRSNDAAVVGEHPCEFLKRDAAMSQKARRSIGIKCDNARLNANLCRLADQHGVNAPIKLLQHMVGGGGGEATEAIRTWRCDRRSCCANECECRFVSWEAHANGLESGADQTRNLMSRSGNDRECTWPEGICKDRDARVGERSFGEEPREVVTIGDVHDERLWMPVAALAGGRGNSSCLVGTPQQVAEAMLKYYRMGIHSFLIRGFDPVNDVSEYGRELIPRLKLGAQEIDAG